MSGTRLCVGMHTHSDAARYFARTESVLPRSAVLFAVSIFRCYEATAPKADDGLIEKRGAGVDGTLE